MAQDTLTSTHEQRGWERDDRGKCIPVLASRCPSFIKPTPWSSLDSFSSSPMPLKPEAALAVHATSRKCYGLGQFLLLGLTASHLSRGAVRLSVRTPSWRCTVPRGWDLCETGMSLRQAGQVQSWQPLPMWIPYKAGGSEGLSSYLLRSGCALFIAQVAGAGCWRPVHTWLGLCKRAVGPQLLPSPLVRLGSRRQAGKGPSCLFPFPLPCHPSCPVASDPAVQALCPGRELSGTAYLQTCCSSTILLWDLQGESRA